MTNLTMLVPFALLAVYVQYGDALRCWSCTSDNDPACADPFLPSRPETGYHIRFEECDGNTGPSYSHLSSSKTACKKQKKYVNGLMVITRGCTWKRADDYTNSCRGNTNGYNEVTTFCETCNNYEGCNGASTIGKTIALLVAPLGLLLFK